MELLKCACGCDKLSKEELEKLINSTQTARDFLANSEAIAMFERMFFETKPIPKVFKYLQLIKTAKGFMNDPSTLDVNDDSPETFMGQIDESFSDALYDCTNNEDRKKVLEKVIQEYTVRFDRSEEYKKFQENLRKAYDGRASISRSDS